VVDPSIEIRSTYLTEQGFSGFNSETLAFQVAERMYRRGADVDLPRRGSVRLRPVRGGPPAVG
jgi:basic membrane lipoprotein Med (substrate-binding protein (PBP1-ABC) superfamily)